MSENEELDQDMKPRPTTCNMVFYCESGGNECALYAASDDSWWCKYICSSYTYCESKVAQAQKMRAALKDMGVED